MARNLLHPVDGRHAGWLERMSERPLAGDTESEARALLARSEAGVAAGVVLRAYGPQVRAYLLRFARTEAIADDAFSRLCEGVVRDIGRFAFTSSLRTWVYAVARNALAMEHRAEGRQRGRVGSFDGVDVEQIAAEVRDRTVTFLRTEARQRFADVRETLSPDDCEMLVLRLSRGMSWLEIADVHGTPAADRKKSAAALRKRFERLKDQIKAALLEEP